MIYEYECLDCKLLSKYDKLITEYKIEVKLKKGSKKTYCGKHCLIKMRYTAVRWGKGILRLVE